MSADGELYVNENCKDFFGDEIDKVFGKDKWRMDVAPFMDSWNMSLFPKVVEVDIRDDHRHKKIGQVIITSKTILEEGEERPNITLEPYGIKIYKLVEGQLRMVYDDCLGYPYKLIIIFDGNKIDKAIAIQAIEDLKFSWIQEVRLE